MNLQFKEAVLHQMRKQPMKEFSTTDLVALVLAEEYADIEKKEKNPIDDKQRKRETKRQKARLHRKLLYYLNALVEEHKLALTRVSAKGEKHFMLIDYNSQPEENGATTLPIAQLRTLAEKEPLIVHDAAELLTRINSVLINTRKIKSPERLVKMVEAVIPLVNDALLLDNMEYYVNNILPGELVTLLKRTLSRIPDSLAANLLIDLDKVDDTERLMRTLAGLLPQAPRNIRVVCKTSAKSISEEESSFVSLLELFREHHADITIANKQTGIGPAFVGSLGPYILDKRRWELSIRNDNAPQIMIVSFNTVTLRLDEMLRQKRTYHQITDSVLEVGKALLRVNYLQYLLEQKQFEPLIRINYPHIIETNLLSANMLRIADAFELSRADPATLPSFLSTLERTMLDFVIMERSIYKSCGMPLTFNLQLAGDSGARIMLANHECSQHEKDILTVAEQVASAFRNCFELTVSHRNRLTTREIAKSLEYLLTYYRLPILTYAFQHETEKALTLQAFLGDRG